MTANEERRLVKILLTRGVTLRRGAHPGHPGGDRSFSMPGGAGSTRSPKGWNAFPAEDSTFSCWTWGLPDSLGLDTLKAAATRYPHVPIIILRAWPMRSWPPGRSRRAPRTTRSREISTSRLWPRARFATPSNGTGSRPNQSLTLAVRAHRPVTNRRGFSSPWPGSRSRSPTA